MAKTADDESYLKQLGEEGRNYWIGLKKLGFLSPCSNDGCNNRLGWEDGSNFVHNGVLSVTASHHVYDTVYGKCFFVGDQGAFDESCTTEKKTFFCQYECPATTTTTTTTTPTTTSTSTTTTSTSTTATPTTTSETTECGQAGTCSQVTQD